MEEEYIQLLTISINGFSKEALTEATIRTGGDDENNVTYRIDTHWWHLYQMKIRDISRGKFHHLFKVAKLVLSVINSNAVEESFFNVWERVLHNIVIVSHLMVRWVASSNSKWIDQQMKRVMNTLRVTQYWKKLEQQQRRNTQVKKHCQNEDMEKIKRRSSIFIIFTMAATL